MNNIFGQGQNFSSAPISSADWANVAGAFFCTLLFALLIAAFMVFLFHRIFTRAGYNGWIGLLALIPGIGSLICLCILAFDTWPLKKKQAASEVRCILPGYGEGTFIPDPPAAPAPVESAPVPQPPAPVVPEPEPAPAPVPEPEPTPPVSPTEGGPSL